MSFDLDFINRPNPVEPSALNHGSLTDKARELDRSTNEQLIPFLLSSHHSQQRRDAPIESARLPINHSRSNGASIAAVLNDNESSSQWLGDQPLMRRDVDQTLYTLPKLPLKRGTKRHRVPPVLQGLHQPPPTSGLLPSISAEDTQVLLSTAGNSRPIIETAVEKLQYVSRVADVAASPPRPYIKAPAKRVANRWSEQETNDLLDGVVKFGIGSWKRILLCPDYTFNKRTAVDLKDRFRVCKPNAYGQPRTKKARAEAEQRLKSGVTTTPTTTTATVSSQPIAEDTGRIEQTIDASNTATSQAKNTEQIAQSDNQTTLWKVNRRQRRKFTAQEDAALLSGYLEHGVSWMTIVKDTIFRENHRTPTDLRDRFRTRYPEKYAQAGLAPRPGNFPKPRPRTQSQMEEGEQQITDVPPAVVKATAEPSAPTNMISSSKFGRQHALPMHTHGIPFPLTAEDYLPEFGFPEDDDDDDDAHPIVLDRSIMDWANSTMPSSSSFASNNRLQPLLNNDNATGLYPGIDPLVTLKLPRPGLF